MCGVRGVWVSSGCAGRFMSIVNPVSAKLMGQDGSSVAAVSLRCVLLLFTVAGSGWVLFVFDLVSRVVSAIVVVFFFSRLFDQFLQI